MQIKEYIRLGKISIKSRKKSTRNTVCGIAFGLIMLVPIVFFTLAFYIGLTDRFNSTKNISSFYLTAVDENSEQDGYLNDPYIVFGNSDVDALEKRRGKEVEDIIYSQRYDFSRISGTSFSLTIAGVKKTVSGDAYYAFDSSRRDAYCSLKVIDRERSHGKLFPTGFEKDLEALGKNVFAAGGGFSENGKGEIIISERLADRFGIDLQTAVGSKVTLTVSGRFDNASSYANGLSRVYYLDNDSNPDNTYSPAYGGASFTVDVLHDFEIVGVISSDYFALNYELRWDSNLWICENSAYEVSGGQRRLKYLPFLSTGKAESDGGKTQEYQVVTYSQTGTDGMVSLSKQAAEERMFFPAIPALAFVRDRYLFSDHMSEYPYTRIIVQCEKYKSAVKIESLLNNVCSRFEGDSSGEYDGDYLAYGCCITEAYSDLTLLHKIGLYLMLIMYTFGGVIFFATMLNLYNSVNYSVQVRRNYIGMLRAIGAKQKMIPRLYFVEILLIFWRSLLWVLIFGGGISLGIKLYVDMLFKREESAIFGIPISLNFGWFFAALVMAFAVVFLIAFLFSRVACGSVSRKGILEALSDEK